MENLRSRTLKELLFLVSELLDKASPCQESAKTLKRELREHKLLPTTIDWKGQEQMATQEQLQYTAGCLSQTHLLDMVHSMLHQVQSSSVSTAGSGEDASVADPSSVSLLATASRSYTLSNGLKPRRKYLAKLCELRELTEKRRQQECIMERNSNFPRARFVPGTDHCFVIARFTKGFHGAPGTWKTGEMVLYGLPAWCDVKLPDPYSAKDVTEKHTTTIPPLGHMHPLTILGPPCFGSKQTVKFQLRATEWTIDDTVTAHSWHGGDVVQSDTHSPWVSIRVTGTPQTLSNFRSVIVAWNKSYQNATASVKRLSAEMMIARAELAKLAPAVTPHNTSSLVNRAAQPYLKRLRPTPNFLQSFVSRQHQVRLMGYSSARGIASDRHCDPYVADDPPNYVLSRFKQVLKVDTHLGYAGHCVEFSRRTGRIVTAAEDHLIKVFSSHSGQLLYTLKGHRSAINDIGLDSSDQVIASAAGQSTGADTMIRLWNLTTGYPVAILHGHKKMVNLVTWMSVQNSMLERLKRLKLKSYDRKTNTEHLVQQLLISSSEDGTCRVWNTVLMNPQENYIGSNAIQNIVLKLGETDVVSLEAHPTESEIVAAGDNGMVIVWDLRQLFLTGKWPSKSGSYVRSTVLREEDSVKSKVLINILAYSHRGDRLLVQQQNPSMARIFVRDARTNSFPSQLRQDSTKNNVAENKPILLSLPRSIYNEVSYRRGTRSNTAIKLTKATWTCNDVLIVTAHMREPPASALKKDPARPLWVKANFDPRITVWESNTGSPLHCFGGHTKQIDVLDPHPLYPYVVASAGYNGSIIFWDVRKGKQLCRFENKIPGGSRRFRTVHINRQNLQVELIPGTRAAVHHGCWSHDGFKFAVVDSFGCWTLFGAGLSHETYAATPTEQYFKSDYDKMVFDDRHVAFDAERGIPLHLAKQRVSINFQRMRYRHQPPQCRQIGNTAQDTFENMRSPASQVSLNTPQNYHTQPVEQDNWQLRVRQAADQRVASHQGIENHATHANVVNTHDEHFLCMWSSSQDSANTRLLRRGSMNPISNDDNNDGGNSEGSASDSDDSDGHRGTRRGRSAQLRTNTLPRRTGRTRTRKSGRRTPQEQRERGAYSTPSERPSWIRDTREERYKRRLANSNDLSSSAVTSTKLGRKRMKKSARRSTLRIGRTNVTTPSPVSRKTQRQDLPSNDAVKAAGQPSQRLVLSRTVKRKHNYVVTDELSSEENATDSDSKDDEGDNNIKKRSRSTKNVNFVYSNQKLLANWITDENSQVFVPQAQDVVVFVTDGYLEANSKLPLKWLSTCSHARAVIQDVHYYFQQYPDNTKRVACRLKLCFDAMLKLEPACSSSTFSSSSASAPSSSPPSSSQRTTSQNATAGNVSDQFDALPGGTKQEATIMYFGNVSFLVLADRFNTVLTPAIHSVNDTVIATHEYKNVTGKILDIGQQNWNPITVQLLQDAKRIKLNAWDIMHGPGCTKIQEAKNAANAIPTEFVRRTYFLMRTLMELSQQDCCEAFLQPAPLVAVQYCEHVPVPMCIGDIINKLRSRWYRAVDAIVSDINLICSNCVLFNGKNSVYARDAKRVVRLLENGVRSCMDEQFFEYDSPAYLAADDDKPSSISVRCHQHLLLARFELDVKDVVKLNRQTFPELRATSLLRANTEVLLPRNHASVMNFAKRETQETQGKLTAQTLGKFRSIVEKVVALDEIGIFAVPVLESQAFNYFTFVRNPMDFGTLRKNLGDDSDVCKYDTFLDAYEDLQRIFLNCIHYNQEAKVRDGSLGSVAFKLLCTTRELVNEAFP